MADLNNQFNNVTVVNYPNWGAIWAGVFTFIAIWSVFGALGLGVFASSANPNASQPVSGMSVGMAIWSIVLTIIAMFVAGRTTGHLAGITNPGEGLTHGMIMFGLSVTAALVILAVGGGAMSNTASMNGATAGRESYLLGMFADLGWTLFISLFLGWLAALGGASTAHKELPRQAAQQQVRHA